MISCNPEEKESKDETLGEELNETSSKLNIFGWQKNPSALSSDAQSRLWFMGTDVDCGP